MLSFLAEHFDLYQPVAARGQEADRYDEAKALGL